MDEKRHCFVEWKEQYVSKEKGHRVVHYFLKDLSGDFVLAVVGTERSLRHMFYVVAEEFLSAVGEEDSVNAGYRWRSRREVVNWLTSMLSLQHGPKSPKNDPTYTLGQRAEYKGHLAKSLRGHTSDIVWSGDAWTCGKQLKHYPSFRRNGIEIAVQSFVFVMAEEENHHLAYLEDMYEDRKGHRKVRVRWFHRTQEVKGVTSLRNPHPKEVFITPYVQVISAECVDGPATVLTREHYDKFLEIIPSDLLTRVYLCHRQFKSNRVKPFKLSKFRGYFDQPIFACVGPDFFEDDEFSSDENGTVGAKRMRSCRNETSLHFNRKICRSRLDIRSLSEVSIKVNEKIELLCQDSGIRGCWFKCTVLEVNRKQMKVQYDDVKDEDGSGNLEEWVPIFRVAMPDKVGMRYPGRPTIRPAVDHNEMMASHAFEVGSSVDAWWSDGWWEGVVAGTTNNENEECFQVCIPSESLFLSINRKDLRVSRDWTGDKWVDIESNPEIALKISASISPETKNSTSSIVAKEPESNDVLLSCNAVLKVTKLDMVKEEKPGPNNLVPSEDLSTNTNRPKDENCLSVEEIAKVSTPIDPNCLGKEGPDDCVALNNVNELEESQTGVKKSEVELLGTEA